MIVDSAGSSRISEGGLFTRESTLATPPLPSLTAVMLALPGLIAVTSPLELTVATAGSFVDQATLRPERALPEASRNVVVAWVVCPTMMLEDASETDTDATGAGATVSKADPIRPSLLAETVTVPAPAAVTRPAPEEVATAESLVAQLTVRPSSTFPAASCSVAVASVVSPVSILGFASVTATVATWTIAATGGLVVALGSSEPPPPQPTQTSVATQSAIN
jgi:membrane-associated protease RseP (regulator of RpoE activity)